MRSTSKLYVNLVIAIVLVSVFAGALIQIKPVSAASTSATWNPSLGWDFESHSNTHPSFISLTVSQMKGELDAVNAAFEAHGYPPPQHFAYPYGDYNAQVEQVVSTYYKSARTVSDNMTTFPVPDWYALNAAQLVSTTTWSDVTGWISQCIAQKALLVIFTHDLSANPSEYGCTPQMLTRILDYLVQEQNAGNITVMTMAQAYDYWSTAKAGKPTVVMCFDDANESDYTVAYPLFKARGLKGTSFIVTSYIDEDQQLSWAEIAEMRASSSTTYTLQLQSNQNSSATTNLGTITFAGALYSLPNSISTASGNYQAQYSPATGYAFDHWGTSGSVTVTNITANPTTANIAGAGTLTAVYKASGNTLFSDGFESSSFNAWTSTLLSAGASASVTRSAAYQGSYGASFVSKGNGGYEYSSCYKSITSSSGLYARGYVNITMSGISSNNNRFYFLIFMAGTNPVAYAGWRMVGGVVKWDLLIRDGTGWVDSYSASSPQLNTWYGVELHWYESSTSGYAQMYVNGQLTCSIQGRNTATFGNAKTVYAGLAELYNCQATRLCFDNCVISNAYIPA